MDLNHFFSNESADNMKENFKSISPYFLRYVVSFLHESKKINIDLYGNNSGAIVACEDFGKSQLNLLLSKEGSFILQLICDDSTGQPVTMMHVLDKDQKQDLPAGLVKLMQQVIKTEQKAVFKL